jgi:hypothetical protein
MLLKWIQAPGQTIKRWCIWWRESFARSAFFKTERGRFKPQIENATLPTSLLLCFEDAELSSLQRFLRFLTPLSKGR